MVSKETLDRMSDESRFPTDELSALVYKMLLQHMVEMDHLDDMLKRHEAGHKMAQAKEYAVLTEAQRQVHLEVVKRFPQFQYAGEVSYSYNLAVDKPQMIAVTPEGYPGNFKVVHDFKRDALLQSMMEEVFKHHTQVFENGTYEFCWELTGSEHQVTYAPVTSIEGTLQ